jgi:hypothetical protein
LGKHNSDIERNRWAIVKFTNSNAYHAREKPEMASSYKSRWPENDKTTRLSSEV